jgi:hypothetical protein
MHHASSRRKIVFLLLIAALLIAPWASAAPRHGSAHPMSLSGELGITDFLSRAWNLLAGAWTKEGCNIDPSGRCGSTLTAPSPLPIKEGCHIDPDGRCRFGSSSSLTDAGCNIDPNGRCGS